MLDILLLMILIYQKTLQATAEIFYGWSSHFSPDTMANFTVYVKTRPGKMFLSSFALIFKILLIVAGLFYNRK